MYGDVEKDLVIETFDSQLLSLKGHSQKKAWRNWALLINFDPAFWRKVPLRELLHVRTGLVGDE